MLKMNFSLSTFLIVGVCCSLTLAQPGGISDRAVQHEPERWPPVFPGIPFTRYPPIDPPFPFTLPTFITDYPFNPTPTTQAPEVTSSPVGIPGGIQDVTQITQVHRDMADFAAREIGSEYTLGSLRRVREQVVSGMNYHMEIVVNKTTSAGVTTYECDVRVYHVVWISKKSLEEFSCRKPIAPING
ncbi:regulation of elastin catabolic process [Mactra antiquata]